MNLSIARLKTIKAMSEETLCFSADLLLDGRKIAEVSNHGHGGCDMLHPVDREAVARVEAWVKTLPAIETDMADPHDKTKKFSYQPDLDHVVGRLIDQIEVEKAIKRALKTKYHFFLGEESDLRTYPRKWKGQALTLDRVKASAAKKYPGAPVIFLDDLPEAEAIARFRATLDKADAAHA